MNEKKTLDSSELSEHEKNIGRAYDNAWPQFIDFWGIDESLGIHLGYYEPGVIRYKDQVLNMNKYIGYLLELPKEESMKVLDVGCGVGGTSIYLANKYKNINITGITVAEEQVHLATKFARQRNASNVNFSLCSYLHTNFPNNHFDRIFALESSAYAENYYHFLDEMTRILKPKGKLVIIEGFRIDKNVSSFINLIYDNYYNSFGGANPPYIKNIEKYLSEKRFIGIKINDISRNIIPSLIISSIVLFPIFCVKEIKDIGNHFKKNLEEGYQVSRLANIYGIILGISGHLKYQSVVAEKS